jgi:hypothetical protein
MKICVLTNPGAHGEQEPRAFQLGGRRVPVIAILDRWEAPAHHYFQVRDYEGRRFVLKHDPQTGTWELEAVYGKRAVHPKQAQRTPA